MQENQYKQPVLMTKNNEGQNNIGTFLNASQIFKMLFC